MALAIVMLPLINYLLFVLFARHVTRSTLALYVIASMLGTLAYLLLSFGAIVDGNVYVATVGN